MRIPKPPEPREAYLTRPNCDAWVIEAGECAGTGSPEHGLMPPRGRRKQVERSLGRPRSTTWLTLAMAAFVRCATPASQCGCDDGDALAYAPTDAAV